MVSGEEHIYFPCPWKLRTQEMNKVNKRKNVNTGHCEVTSIRGKVVINVQRMKNAHSAGNEISRNSSSLCLILKATRTSGYGGTWGEGRDCQSKEKQINRVPGAETALHQILSLAAAFVVPG